MIGLVYDSLLADFHLCYGYWRKPCCALLTRVVEVFEQSMQSATYSSGVWFTILIWPCQHLKFLMMSIDYSKWVSFIGKNCLCRTLWDYSNTFGFDFFQHYWGFSSSDICAKIDSFKQLAAAYRICA